MRKLDGVLGGHERARLREAHSCIDARDRDSDQRTSDIGALDIPARPIRDMADWLRSDFNVVVSERNAFDSRALQPLRRRRQLRL